MRPPMSHGAGIYAIPHVMAGARHVVPASGGFDPGRDLRAGRRASAGCRCSPRPRSSSGWSTMREAIGRRLLRASRPSCTAARRCTPPTSQRAIRVMGPRFVQIYGQGESPMVITALSRAQLADTAPSASCAADRLGRRGADAGRGAGRQRRWAAAADRAKSAKCWCAATP